MLISHSRWENNASERSKMSQNVKNRIEWIDYSKGILIILVIAGHAIPEFDLHLDYLAHFIYSFHMPDFFILSGYLFRYKKDINTVEFAKKKAKQLLIPYIIFCVLIFLCHLAKQIVLGTDAKFFTMLKTKKHILGTIFMTRDSVFSNMWFLPAIFSAFCMLFVIFQISKDEKTRAMICMAVGLLGLLWGKAELTALPISMEAGMLAVSFMYVGYVINAFKIDNYFGYRWVEGSSICFLLLVNYLSHNVLRYRQDSFYNVTFSNIFLFIVTAMIGLITVVGFSKYLHNSKYLSYLGRNSLYVYGLHFLNQNIIGFIGWPRGNAIGNLLILVVLTALNSIMCVIEIVIYNSIKRYLKTRV